MPIQIHWKYHHQKWQISDKKNMISSVFPKRGNRNAKMTEKHKNKMKQGKTYM